MIARDIRTSAHAFLGDDRGTTAILFAMLAVVLIGIGGAAVDYNTATNARAKLQQAADAAALAAVNDPYATDAKVQEIAKAYVKGNMQGFIGGSVPNISVTRTTGDSPKTTVDISYDAPTTMLSILGFSKLSLNVRAAATNQLHVEELYAAIDMSESMGIAADDTARDALKALTAPYLTASATDSGGCAFGCHARDGWEPAGKSVYQMAKDANIKLREDVLAKAFGDFVDAYLDPSDPAVIANRRRMSVIGFSEDARMLLATSTNTAAIKTASAAFPDGDRKSTKFEVAMPRIKDMVGPQGTGSTTSPNKTLLLVTDGLRWNRNSTDGLNGPVNVALCDQFKSAGIKVAVVEVKYQEDPGEYWFETLVRPSFADIGPGLEACASPGFYFKAEDSDGATLAKTFELARQAIGSKIALSQ